MNAPSCLDQAALIAADAEQSVLGALLLVPDSFDRLGDLTESDFHSEAHRLIFRHIALLQAQHAGVDVLTVSDALTQSGQLERAGGFGYLAELASNVAGASNIGRYARIVTDKRRLRDLLATSADIAAICTAPTGQSAEERIDAAQAKLLALSDARPPVREPKEAGSILSDVLSDIEARVERGGALHGLPTGLAGIDAALSGLQAGDLIIIAGRPSMGKTALALNIAENVAMAGKTALVFSLEMGEKQIVERSIASLSGVELSVLRSGQLTQEHYDRMFSASARLASAKLLIDESPALSVSQMRGRARRVKRLHGLDLIVIDYLQLMGGTPSAQSNRNEEISQLTRGLKLMARDLGVPLILLSQLSRKVEERTSKRPMLSDLRDSGSIEQDADIVAFVYRDEYYNPDSPYKGLAEVLIRKHRMGELADIPMVFQGQFSRFRDADPGSVQAAHEAARVTQQPRRRASRGGDEF